jgi:hypothetical protein
VDCGAARGAPVQKNHDPQARAQRDQPRFGRRHHADHVSDARGDPCWSRPASGVPAGQEPTLGYGAGPSAGWSGQFECEGGDRPPHVGSLCHIPGGMPTGKGHVRLPASARRVVERKASRVSDRTWSNHRRDAGGTRLAGTPPTQDDAMCTDQPGGCMDRVAVSGTREAAMEIAMETEKIPRWRQVRPRSRRESMLRPPSPGAGCPTLTGREGRPSRAVRARAKGDRERDRPAGSAEPPAVVPREAQA